MSRCSNDLIQNHSKRYQSLWWYRSFHLIKNSLIFGERFARTLEERFYWWKNLVGSFIQVSAMVSAYYKFKSMWNTAVGIKNCKQFFSLRVAFTTQKKATRAAEMMSVERVAIFWVVNASSSEKSCLQFSIPTESGAGGEGRVSHSLKG